jgi:hypothetical protein
MLEEYENISVLKVPMGMYVEVQSIVYVINVLFCKCMIPLIVIIFAIMLPGSSRRFRSSFGRS